MVIHFQQVKPVAVALVFMMSATISLSAVSQTIKRGRIAQQHSPIQAQNLSEDENENHRYEDF